jgi:hypothetical protein
LLRRRSSGESVGARMAARITDLSALGCYVDTINPLPGGTPVLIKIFNHAQQFEAPATVFYSHTHLGMGLAFREVQPISGKVCYRTGFRILCKPPREG